MVHAQTEDFCQDESRRKGTRWLQGLDVDYEPKIRSEWVRKLS
jgi:hypothetical protein